MKGARSTAYVPILRNKALSLENSCSIGLKTVGRKVKRDGAAGFDRLGDAIDVMHADIVEEHDVASSESWGKKLLDVSPECLPVHGPVEDKRGGDAIMAQRGDECDRLPVSVRHLLHQPFTSGRPAIKTCDRCRDTGFVNEYKAFRIQARLLPLQGLTGGDYVRAILLGGPQTFF